MTTALMLAAAAGGAAAQEQEADPTEAPLELVATPSEPEGPYYPIELPADRDSDLTVVDEAGPPVVGMPLVIDGLLLGTDGSPVEDAVVEIWQTDRRGVYLHPADPGFADRDTAFQGFGESVTDASGAWSFRTVLPEIYGGRPRHIHAKVKVDGISVLTTQIYFSGGDIPQTGAVALGETTAPLAVEVLVGLDADGEDVLHAQHLLVIPEIQGG